MRTVMMIVTVVALAFGAGACKKGGTAAGGGGDPCAAKSKCANQPAPAAFEMEFCKQFVADPKCGAKAKAQMECQMQNEACTADGKRDDIKTAEACQSQVDAFAECIGMGAGAPGSPPEAPAAPAAPPATP